MTAGVSPAGAEAIAGDLSVVLAAAIYATELDNWPGFAAWLNSESPKYGINVDELGAVTDVDRLLFVNAIARCTAILQIAQQITNRGSN